MKTSNLHKKAIKAGTTSKHGYLKILSYDQKSSDIQQSLNIAVRHHSAGRLAEAERIYQEILRADPNEPRALQLLGAIAHQMGKNDIAVDLFTKALAIKPDYVDACYNLGIALRELGELDKAADSYRKALSIKPDLAEAHSSLGVTLQDLGQMDEAVASFRKAVAIKPDFAEAHSNLGIALQKLWKLDEAVACFHQSLKIKPDYAEAHNNLGKALTEQGRLDEAFASYRKALDIKPDYAKAHSNLLLSLNYHPDYGPSEKLEEARRFGDVAASRSSAVSNHPNIRDPNRRLKVGFVSGDFRIHSVSHFLRGILPLINAGEFELYAYSTHHKEDDVTLQLRKCFAEWRKVVGDSVDKLIETIVADEIDILIDLSGHSAGNRLPVFARKPAPVQVTWLGYSGATGLHAIDYILCDRWVIPPGEEEYYTETPWRLPDGYLCFSAPGAGVQSDVAPNESNFHITFGSFNNISKISDPTVACWAKILRAVPDSRLLLKAKQLEDETVRQGIWDRFAGFGVARERVILKGRIPTPAEHLALYNHVDIALDPFPYCGTTTTAEALWMGVPVVTLRGRGFVSRVGESILNNIGKSAWVTGSPDDYVETAVNLAANQSELNSLRRGLRETVLTSPLCDAPRFARHLEDALRGMWRNWCDVSG